MKKWMALFVAAVLLVTLAVPAMAAQTGVYIDEVVDYATTPVAEVVDISQYMCFENNPDLEVTHLVKAAHQEDVEAGLTYQQKANHSEYIVYKMAENIGGFELFVNCCAGLGDPMADISVYISKTGEENSWVEVRKQATELFYNDEIYIHYDKAYWHHAVVMNNQKIPKGYTYLKVQLNACNDKDDVPWNVAIDTVKIVLGDGVAVPTLPAIDKSLTKPSATTTTTTTTKGQGGVTTTTTKGQGGVTTTTTKGQDGETTTLAGGETTTLAGGETTTTQQGDASQDAGATTTTAPTTGGVSGDPSADQPKDEPNALPWIIGGVVAAIVIAGAVLFFVLEKKKSK